jgi:hypothetical protein
LQWLSEDGARVRRPIIESGDTLALGFTADVRAKLEDVL